jgi:lipoate-protein ligase A
VKAWRRLDTGALPADLNMGIDLALLELHSRGISPPTLRFYQWDPPAVSLGYFQRRHSIDLSVCRKMGLDVVKRPTGGHAVLHGHDLTYSVVAGAAEGIPANLATAYHLLSKGLLSGFSLLGIEAERGGGNLQMPETDVCFMRFTLGDLLYRGKKFVGSAQTLKGSSLLQHGSIVLDAQHESWVNLVSQKADSAEELRQHLESRTTSLGEILGRRVEPEEVKAVLIAGLASALDVEFQTGELTTDEWALAREIAGKQTMNK